MEDIIFRIIGSLGLMFIIAGMLFKDRFRDRRDEIYIVGGLFLTAYSLYLKDAIFIILQIAFTLVAVYDLIKNKKKGQKDA